MNGNELYELCIALFQMVKFIFNTKINILKT
jgi:hypothetical protein